MKCALGFSPALFKSQTDPWTVVNDERAGHIIISFHMPKKSVKVKLFF
jgi:hypothetical protein